MNFGLEVDGGILATVAHRFNGHQAAERLFPYNTETGNLENQTVSVMVKRVHL